MIDKLNIKGHLTIKLDNTIVRDISNLVVDTGKNWILNRFINIGIPNQMQYFGIGSGTTNVTKANVTGNMPLISGYDFNVNNKTFIINYKNSGNVTVTLDNNTTSLTELVELINNRLQLNGITQVVCVESTNYVKLQTVEVGPGQYFTISSGSPDALVILGITENTYTGTGVLVTDTTLETQISRSIINSAQITDNYIIYNNTFPQDTYSNISEAGIFNASSGGTMLARTVFNPFSVNIEQTMSLLWKLTIT